MTYIEQFLSQHIISYYLGALGAGKGHRLFADYRSSPNFFSLTWQILLFGENITRSPSRAWLVELIATNLRIAYDDLRDVALPASERDPLAIAFIKRSFAYVHVQMHQIMIRIILAHLAIAQTGALTAAVDELVREIGYIYPALKAEISFSGEDINLADWLEHYLTQLIKEKSPSPLFYHFLEKVKSECNFIGPIERLFEKLAMYQDADDEKTREKEYESSVYEQSRSESVSKYSQDRVFNDLDLFRKKKRILKDRYRASNYSSAAFATPLKREEAASNLPTTDKADSEGQFNNQSSQPLSNSNSQSQLATGSSTFSKLLKKYKKPMVRTMYQGVTKTFVPKRTIGVNGYTADQFIENLTASSSLTSNESLQPFEIGRKSSSRLCKPSFETEQISEFCVPQTPKQEPLRKVSVGEGRKAGRFKI